LTILPARKFRGSFVLPGDKSISHRLALFGAVAMGDTRIRNFSAAADCHSTLDCLGGLGVRIRREPSLITVSGQGFESLTAPAAALDCGNSGSTLRMLAGILAGRRFVSTLTGDDSLRRRPVERVAAPLRAMGARLTAAGGKPPLTIEGAPLRGLDWRLEVASAQAKTAVLLAGLQAEGRTSVSEPHASRDHTERLLPAFGVALTRDGNRVGVLGGARLRAVEMTVPGDASSAAFLVIAALLLPDAEIRVEGVSLNSGRTAFLDVLREMGGDIEVIPGASGPEPVGTIVARSSSLRGIEITPERVPSLIDEIPALAVAGAVAEGAFRVSGAAELRVKESDRIAALAEGLGRMGVSVAEHADGFALPGAQRLRGARVRSLGDHRIAMALAVAGLAASGETEIEGAECVAVSFPSFFDVLRAATARG
jgi:3-phosphoshikimate 1-carboxyvinyltransferase